MHVRSTLLPRERDATPGAETHGHGETHGHHDRAECLRSISHAIDDLELGFWPINKKIHDNPELGFKEHLAHDLLTDYVASHRGWKVTRSAYGMETAWVAVYEITGGDSGHGAVISFNAEMDALPGIGHSCGHNLIASASVLGAIATAQVLKKLSVTGKVVLYGTPAEEGGGGKIKLLEAGAYSSEHVDVSLITHPLNIGNRSLMPTTALTEFTVEYFGREAHAALNPWLGINALDALVSGYNNMSMLRQQTMPGDILQGYISHGGAKENIIHAYAAGTFAARAPSQARLEELREKAYACFEAGSVATGAKVKITALQSYKNHVSNRPMAREYAAFFNALVQDPGEKIPTDPEKELALGPMSASTDQGDISYAMPSISVGFDIDTRPSGQGPHNPEFARAAGTRDAYRRALRAAKGLAATAILLCKNEELMDEVKAAWEADMDSAEEEGRKQESLA